ncbi:hypothetical protein HL658_10150 [Azospirillum sp. RWY-5-1]|uniref:DUF2029 domain-containing protein n=1 Tax=Azospirillum oleiclasticum TaxID=2735135 RepID=A0ABX2T819_9PROT|nr:hypothetical protein [Azospirillum oleiclasticum]NYZ12914.1 hypothetical protein [Azospirillum oleiclasticum]NYZ20413.1 hypothetical protein [Azospirillum oleiclasticum]
MPPVALLLSLITVLPSLPVALNSGGVPGAVLYAALVPASLATLAIVEGIPELAERVRRFERAIVALAILALVAAFAVRYPMSQAGLLGLGTDRDEALDLGVGLILEGRFPYHARTYMGVPLTPLPGALLLASPFHLMGAAAWQNLLWMPVGLILLVDAARGLRVRVPLAVVALFGNLTVLQDHMHGGDLGVNSVYAAAALWLVHRAGSAEAPRPWILVSTAAVLAVAVVSRPVFAVVAIAGAAFVVGRQGPRAGAVFAAVLAAVAAALLLPFLLYDPAAVLPRHLLSKLPPGWLGPAFAMAAAGLLVAALPALRPVTGIPALYGTVAAGLGVMLAVPVGVGWLGWARTVEYAAPACQFAALALLPSCRVTENPLKAMSIRAMVTACRRR